MAIMFEAAFPQYYAKYREAFDASVWFTDDPGPFLGRPSFTNSKGGLARIARAWDLLPASPSDSSKAAKFSSLNPKRNFCEFQFLSYNFSSFANRYEPGSVCIFYSSMTYHQVARFTPPPQTQEQKVDNITPGRIGTVMFFPEPIYHLLKGTEVGWARQTDFKRNEDLVPRLRI